MQYVHSTRPANCQFRMLAQISVFYVVAYKSLRGCMHRSCLVLQGNLHSGGSIWSSNTSQDFVSITKPFQNCESLACSYNNFMNCGSVTLVAEFLLDFTCMQITLLGSHIGRLKCVFLGKDVSSRSSSPKLGAGEENAVFFSCLSVFQIIRVVRSLKRTRSSK